MSRWLWIVSFVYLFFLTLVQSREQDEIVLTILYNNVEHSPELTTDWGFACLIHGMEENILFDTGADVGILSKNFDQYGYYTLGVETVVISHLHQDHTGGIRLILDETYGWRRKVYFPELVPESLSEYGEKHFLMPVETRTQVCKDAYTTGVLDRTTPEQGLILDTEQGLVLIVGCSHPGIVEMAERVQKLYPDKSIHLILGGFHLLEISEVELRKIAQRLRDLGVEKIAPTHCTGAQAMAVFKEVFADDYVEAGVGKTIRIPKSIPVRKGEYFGQQPPGNTATLFATGVISTQHLEHSAPSFSKDGKEVYWSRWLRPENGVPQVIMTTRMDDSGVWMKPEVASFSGVCKDGGPMLINHDQSLVFGSRRSLTEKSGDAATWHLFRVDRTDAGWSDPRIVMPEGTTESDFAGSPSVADSGNLYLSFNGNICVSKFEDGTYAYPEPLGSGINSDRLDWTPYVAPDESYLIFSSHRPGGYDGGDLYLAAKLPDGSWSEAVNMGPSVNTWAQERFPCLSPDGKYLFFTRWMPECDHDVYWVSAAVIDEVVSGILQSDQN